MTLADALLYAAAFLAAINGAIVGLMAVRRRPSPSDYFGEITSDPDRPSPLPTDHLRSDGML